MSNHARVPQTDCSEVLALANRVAFGGARCTLRYESPPFRGARSR
jgi:hypothetical protein